MPATPSVLFVCVKNGGKSQTAAALMRKVAGDAANPDSAGTMPGDRVNDLCAQALQEVGVDITGKHPQAHHCGDGAGRGPRGHPRQGSESRRGRGHPLRELGHRRARRPGTHERAHDRGPAIDGIEGMRLIRDDSAARVTKLAQQLHRI
jgi:arsenate-mycothiol transferase